MPDNVSMHDIPVLMRHQLAEKLRKHADLSWRDAESLGDVFWQFLLSECTDVVKTYEITKRKDDGTEITFSAPYSDHGGIYDIYGHLPMSSIGIRTRLTLPADPLFDSLEDIKAFRERNGMPPLPSRTYEVETNND